MSNEKEILHGLLTQAYGLNEEGVSSLYNEDKSELKPDALTSLLEMDKTRISGLKPDEKKIREEAYGRAKREVMSDYEKQIREKYAISSEKQGLELIDELVAEYRKSADSNLTDDQIKKSKLFLDFAEQQRKERDNLSSEWETKLNGYKAEVQEKETWYTVKDESLKLLDSFKPILPEGKEETWKTIFLDAIRKQKRTIRDNKIVLLDEEGNDLQDGHGHRIPFEQVVKSIADGMFTYQKAEDRSNPNYKPGQGNDRKFTFASEDDFKRQIEAETDDKVKSAMAKAFFEWRRGG